LHGVKTERTAWEHEVDKLKLENAALDLRGEQITTEVVVEYRDRIQYIDKVSVQTVKEFVTVESDKKCTVNVGFVRLHDALVREQII